jgi:hypothetical protein
MGEQEPSADERLEHTRLELRALVSELRDLRTRGAISDAVYTLVLRKLRDTVGLMQEIPDVPLPRKDPSFEP